MPESMPRSRSELGAASPAAPPRPKPGAAPAPREVRSSDGGPPKRRFRREELHARREQARKSIYLRDGKLRARIIVHMGSCGIAAGASAVLASVTEALRKCGRDDIALVASGCAGFCSMEPMMTVLLSDAPPVKYGTLNAASAARVFAEHVLGGRILAENVIGAGSERTA